MKNFKWYRKLRKGVWYYNRYWIDSGITCIFWWSRKFLGTKGGNLCIVYSEDYD